MKYTKEERLDIGRRIYDGELTRYEAAELYGVCDLTAREYMRLYRDVNGLPPKNSSKKRKKSIKSSVGSAPANMEDLEAMTKEELIYELVKARITEARLKKGYEVKGVGADKEYIRYVKKNTK